jgi:dihydrofolate synthase/folylpolyglutamate synthase
VRAPFGNYYNLSLSLLGVSGLQTAEADSVIEDAALERECELWRVGKEIQVMDRTRSGEEQKFDVRAPFGNYYNLSLSLLGAHQIENAAQAIGLAKALEKKTRLKISDEAVIKGVLDARWPGRLEKIEEKPLFILDGAQNKDSAEKIVAALHRHFSFNRLVVLLGTSQDKDLHGILQALAPDTSQLIATRSANPRATDPSVIREEAASAGIAAESEPDLRKAIAQARAAAGPEDLILATGSLFLVADIKKELGQHA